MYIRIINDKKGISLLEITIATIVLSIVVLTAGTIYVSSLRELSRCVDEARVQKQAFFALDHIFLNLMGAKNINGISLPIIVDTDDSNYSPKIRYEVENGKIKFTYKIGAPGEAFEYITDNNVNVDSLAFSRPLTQDMDGSSGLIIKNYVAVDITMSSGQMQESYSTGVALRGMSGA